MASSELSSDMRMLTGMHMTKRVDPVMWPRMDSLRADTGCDVSSATSTYAVDRQLQPLII